MLKINLQAVFNFFLNLTKFFLMDTLIKQELHQLIDNCDNELLLEEAKSLLQNNNVKDWWDELTEEDKSSLTICQKPNTKTAISSPTPS